MPAAIVQAVAPLLGALLTVAGCWAAGVLLIRWLGLAQKLDRLERVPLAFVSGASILHLIVFAVLAVDLAYWPIVIVLIALIVFGLRTHRSLTVAAPSRDLRTEPRALASGFAALFAIYFTLYLSNAWAPEISPDGSGYHLGLVARYLRAHGFERVTTSWYAALSAGIEMLYVPAFAIGRHSAAALVHFSFVVALAIAMFAYGRRVGKPLAGAAGALLTFMSPIVGRDGTTAYIDVALAAVCFAVFYWLEIWEGERNPRVLILVGLLAGYAYAAKYTAFVIAIFAISFVAIKAKRMRLVLVVAGFSLLMIAPWFIRNWIWYQNPIAPFGNAIFRNPYFHVLAEQEWAAWLRSYDVPKWRLPLEVLTRGALTNGLLGPIFFLAPLALLSLRSTAGRRLLAAAAVLLAVYPTNVGTRFLIPCLPFVSLALAMAMAERTWLLAAIVIVHAISSWPQVIPKYADRYAWRLERFQFKEALRMIPADQYLHGFGGYRQAQLLERHVPRGESVLSMNGLPEAYTSREVRVSFQAASNEMLTDILMTGFDYGHQPWRTHTFRFPATRGRRWRVVQTGPGSPSDQWSIHEFRFLHQGRELPRRPEWRLIAWPNPWDVQLAFDNSPVTRWRTWERAGPGMFVEVDFGSEEFVDEVRLETSNYVDRVQPRLELESHGRWNAVSDRPEDRTTSPPGAMRFRASRELNLRGVHYVLMSAKDFGATDMRDDPHSWGMEILGETSDSTVYRIVP